MTNPENPVSTGFAADLAAARAAMTPRMALRRFGDGSLDDIVVKDVETVHAEFMHDDLLWIACYFRNGERFTFDVQRTKRPAGLRCVEGEMPNTWIDIDEERGNA